MQNLLATTLTNFFSPSVEVDGPPNTNSLVAGVDIKNKQTIN